MVYALIMTLLLRVTISEMNGLPDEALFKEPVNPLEKWSAFVSLQEVRTRTQQLRRLIL